MSKKSDNYYFKNFVICAEYGEEAARMLERNLKEFDVTHLSERLDEIHGIEHAADQKKHEMLAALVKEFITPIEREDIILLSEAIDEVTDTIEDVMIRLYINNIRMIRPDAEAFAHLITRCCKTLSRLMEEFKNFKKVKKALWTYGGTPYTGRRGRPPFYTGYAQAAYRGFGFSGGNCLERNLYLSGKML